MMKSDKMKLQCYRRCFYYLLIISIIGLNSRFSHAQNNQKSVVIMEAAELTIHGKTNIDSFTCSMAHTYLNDTLATNINLATYQAVIFEGLEILFKVIDFKCDHALMTKDLRLSLKEDEFPFIKMKIDKLQLNSQKGNQWMEAVKASIFLYIAGVQRYEYISDAKIKRNYNKIILSGTLQLLMTDFKITPPTKIFGMVRTNDLLKINFSITLKIQ